jgi:hypothetical protein
MLPPGLALGSATGGCAVSVPAPLPQGELLPISADGLFLAAGCEAACGWPLPDGRLPVGGKGLGGSLRLMTEADWRAYRVRCAAMPAD